MKSVSLLDIAQDVETAQVEVLPGKVFEVRGLTGRGFARLLRRFPDLRKQAVGMIVPVEDMVVTTIELVPVMVASALGHPDDDEWEDLVDRLPAEPKRLLAEAVWGLTMPKESVNPFSKRAADVEPAARASSGKAPATKLRPRSKRSSRQATGLMTSGA